MTERDGGPLVGGVDPADWEALSALADGELREPDGAALRARIAREPALGEALAAIESLRRDLRRWSGAPPRRAPFGLARPAALAAAGALIASVAWLVLLPEGAFAPGPVAVAPAGADEVAVPAPLRTARALDLSEDGLMLVRMEAVGARAVRHYAGPNGCRVRHVMTLTPGRADAGSPLRRDWSVGAIHHALVASGMDRDRFAALAAFAEAQSRAGAAEDLRIARAPGAAPCAA